MAKQKFSLKDHLFNDQTVRFLANQFAQAEPGFNKKKFERRVLQEFPNLELKQRIVQISQVLKQHLPDAFPDALKIILAALPPELNPDLKDNDFGEFIIAPLGHFVAQYGCTTRHRAKSLRALKEITKRFSAEDPIRAFINTFPAPTFKFLMKCAGDKNYHVRRLASEGTRPSLPWSGKLTTPYTDAIPILDKLFSDSTRYVTRSVANHMNDISKLDSKLVLAKLEEWTASERQEAKEMAFISKHSLRTLVAQGDREALRFLGFRSNPKIQIENFQVESSNIRLGESLIFRFDLTSVTDQALIVDYQVEFASKRGKVRKKVFKIKQLDAIGKQTYSFSKKHPMREISTRRLYAGCHRLTLQINGTQFDSIEFDLEI